MIKTADHNRNITTYENFIACCPDCDHRNIFNRRDDLKTTEPIISKKVQCFNIVCNTEFYINGDMLAEKYKYFIFEAQELMLEKKYMHTVTMLCTACEAFFYHAIKVKLVYEPFKDKIITDIDDMNMLFKQLDKNIKSHTFEKLRIIFTYLFFKNVRLDNIEAITKTIKKLKKPDFNKELKNIYKDENIKNDPKKKQLLKSLRKLDVNSLRNAVVHKLAYRPNSEQAELTFDEVIKILTSIELFFDIQAEDNYINNSFRTRRIRRL